MLFANKVDLIEKNNLDHSEIQKTVNSNKFLDYYLTSAKSGQGVHEAFSTLIEQLYNKSKSIEK